MPTPSVPCIAERDRFVGLTAALTHFQQTYPETTFRHKGIDPITGEKSEVVFRAGSTAAKQGVGQEQPQAWSGSGPANTAFLQVCPQKCTITSHAPSK